MLSIEQGGAGENLHLFIMLLAVRVVARAGTAL
jgi:hypothetical protein